MSGIEYDFSSPDRNGPTTSVPVGPPPASSWIPSSTQAFENPNAAMPPPVAGEPSSAAESRYKGLHPIAAFFHVVFKALALIIFLLGSLFLSSVMILILTVLLLAMDFWTTKNITGRLLVSLRWWSEIGEDGQSHWVFESAADEAERVNSYDRWFFWSVLAVNAGVWVLFAVINLMSPGRLVIAVIGAMLTAVNLLGYFKCRREKTKLGEFVLREAAQRPELVQRAAQTLFTDGK